jgi:hypothetical protein
MCSQNFILRPGRAGMSPAEAWRGSKLFAEMAQPDGPPEAQPQVRFRAHCDAGTPTLWQHLTPQRAAWSPATADLLAHSYTGQDGRCYLAPAVDINRRLRVCDLEYGDEMPSRRTRGPGPRARKSEVLARRRPVEAQSHRRLPGW